jgi:hypothetical protein
MRWPSYPTWYILITWLSFFADMFPLLLILSWYSLAYANSYVSEWYTGTSVLLPWLLPYSVKGQQIVGLAIYCTRIRTHIIASTHRRSPCQEIFKNALGHELRPRRDGLIYKKKRLKISSHCPFYVCVLYSISAPRAGVKQTSVLLLANLIWNFFHLFAESVGKHFAGYFALYGSESA